MKYIHIFLGVLLISLFTQGSLWRYDTLTDQQLWQNRIIYFAEDSRNNISAIDQQRYSEHPSMSAIIIGALAPPYRAGAPLAGSLF